MDFWKPKGVTKNFGSYFFFITSSFYPFLTLFSLRGRYPKRKKGSFSKRSMGPCRNLQLGSVKIFAIYTTFCWLNIHVFFSAFSEIIQNSHLQLRNWYFIVLIILNFLFYISYIISENYFIYLFFVYCVMLHIEVK